MPPSKGDVSGLLDLLRLRPALDDGLGFGGSEGAVAMVEVELARLRTYDCDCCDAPFAECSALAGTEDPLNIHCKSVDAIWKDMAEDMTAVTE